MYQDLGFVLIHIINEHGEHTFVLNTVEEIDEIKENFRSSVIKMVNIEDVLNAIRFNSEAYKLQLLGYTK